jgi:hypothetical protein
MTGAVHRYGIQKKKTQQSPTQVVGPDDGVSQFIQCTVVVRLLNLLFPIRLPQHPRNDQVGFLEKSKLEYEDRK